MIITGYADPGAGHTAQRRGRRLSAILIGALAAVALSACSSSAPKPEPSYGALPTYLPSTSITPDSLLTGTVDTPALTTEGDSVRVRLPDTSSVLATVTGPEVPGEGLPYQAASTTCTWTVTLTAASARVSIRVADFTSLDHLGNVYHPKLVAGQPVPPAAVMPGQTVTFELRAIMTVGEGLMRWAPDGKQTAASWDFEVEND